PRTHGLPWQIAGSMVMRDNDIAMMSSWDHTSHRRRAHVAVLVLLAAATRARVVAADLVAAVAYRLDLLVGLAACRRLRRLGCRALRSLLRRRVDDPDRILQPFRLLHAEDVLGHARRDAFPHRAEFLHALTLIFRLRIDLA